MTNGINTVIKDVTMALPDNFYSIDQELWGAAYILAQQNPSLTAIELARFASLAERAMRTDKRLGTSADDTSRYGEHAQMRCVARDVVQAPTDPDAHVTVCDCGPVKEALGDDLASLLATGYTLAQCALHLGIRRQSIYSRIQRARARLA